MEVHKPEYSAMYPDPLVIPPSAAHEKTFIILHGRGDTGDHFGVQLLMWAIDKDETLRTLFPNAKFVFPTASRRRVNTGNRPTSNQWFDNYSPMSIDEQSKDEERQLEGLRESSMFLHKLLRQEILIAGADNIVLGGLSQGCALSLVSMLLWEGPPLNAMFGMCGWLPLRKRMEDIALPTQLDGGEDIHFERQEGDVESVHDLPTQAMNYLQDQLDIPLNTTGPTPPMVLRKMPIFLGHGREDPKVPIGLGREAARCLQVLGARVETREYEGLGHWYSGKMLGDVVRFLTLLRVGEHDGRDT